MDSDKDNSTASYEEHKASGKAGNYRRRIFDLLVANGRSMTDRELMVALDVTDPNYIRPEVTRLKQDGLLTWDGVLRCSVTTRFVRCSKWSGRPYKERDKDARPVSEDKKKVRELTTQLAEYMAAVEQLRHEFDRFKMLNSERVMRLTDHLPVGPIPSHIREEARLNRERRFKLPTTP